MNESNNVVFLHDEQGKRTFAILPYNQYLSLLGENEDTENSADATDDLIFEKKIKVYLNRGYTKLKAWRKASGLTQSQVAEALGTHQTYVSQLELGNLVPDAKTLNSLGVLYSCSPNQLL